MKENVLQVAREHAPCFIYDSEMIRTRCRKLKEVFPDLRFLYSVKTNPFAPILSLMKEEGFGADAASANEVIRAIEAGMSPEQIYYSSPGRTLQDFQKVSGQCVYTADSFHELQLLEELGREQDQIIRAGVRINPCFSMEGGAGVSSKFGIDEEKMDELEQLLSGLPHVKIVGLHFHVKSQVLDEKHLAGYYERCFETAKRLWEREFLEAGFLNFGSGLGVVYNENIQKEPDYSVLSETMRRIVEENRKTVKAELFIETGRFSVCAAGSYFTKIVDIKESRGQKYLVVQNGMNGFLRPAAANYLKAAMGGVLPEFSLEPLYTCEDAYEILLRNENQEENKEMERVSVGGNLCTALDLMADDILLPAAEIGDLIEVTNAGSYGYSLSSLLFSSHDLPEQILV